MINFYPLTIAEQNSFAALTAAKVNNEPMMILTQPTDLLIGVDADDLQSPSYSDYLNALTFDSGKIVALDLEAIGILSSSKGQKQQEISNWFTAAEGAGFDTGLGYFLSFETSKRATYTAYVLLLDHGVSRGSKLPNNSVLILDKDDSPRSITVSNLVDLLTDYGEAYEALFNTNVGFLIALEAAQTTTAVDAIQMP